MKVWAGPFGVILLLSHRATERMINGSRKMSQKHTHKQTQIPPSNNREDTSPTHPLVVRYYNQPTKAFEMMQTNHIRLYLYWDHLYEQK